MAEWLRILGHSDEDVNTLNIIHIAGTKGKGRNPRKIGLYTSPHLIDPEERIRIQSHPLPRNLLAKYFFEIYDKIPQVAEPPDPSKPTVERGPRFLQLWALLGLHTFIREGVDAVVMETHSGGEFDATNVVTKPIVTAITTLGLDHIEMLGNTIEKIAWHKAGIFKIGAVALSTTQAPSAMEVLQHRAAEAGQKVISIDEDSMLPQQSLHLEPAVQRKNASLGAAAAREFLERTTTIGAKPQELSADDLRLGVEQWSWPGRYQILKRDKQTWFLDAAHCELSVSLAAQWFIKESSVLRPQSEEVSQIVIFSHFNKLRDASALLERFTAALKELDAKIDHVVFTTYNEFVEDPAGKPEIFQTFKDIWQKHFPSSHIWEKATVQNAIEVVQSLDKSLEHSHILVTGSQYLVGPVLHLLQK